MGSLINGDAYKAHKWIRKVIKSCNTVDHVNNCDRLVANFSKLYANSDILFRDLQMHLVEKMMFTIPETYFEDAARGYYMYNLDYIYEIE